MYHHTYYELEHWAERLEDVLEAVAFTNSFTGIVSLAAFILGALGLYSMAKRRGIQHSWLSWIPVGNLWILGSLSDQYQWVSRGENKKKRKALLTLGLVSVGLGILVTVLGIAAVVCIVQAAVFETNEDAMIMSTVGLFMGIVALGLGMAGVSIAIMILRFMALYDVYRSANPENAVLFLVLSIVIHVTEGFFLFFNREKDAGMVRKPEENPWNGQNYDSYSCNYDTQKNGETFYGGQLPGKGPEDPWDK